jgi:hypothetical protein
VRVHSGEIQALEKLLSSLRERLARGHESALPAVTVLEQMIAERERQYGDDVESESPSDRRRPVP